MHRALFLSEILREIFWYLKDWLSWSEKSLAALARTCKTFNEPAMDFLWANICSIEPLLGCVTRLHPMIYHDGHEKTFRPQCVEPLSEFEAHQFLRHACRVRSLWVYEDHLHLLSVLPIDACVFPRLSSLTGMVSPSNSRYLPLFLSPTLRRYSLHLTLPSEELKSIGARCPVLEMLSIIRPPRGHTVLEVSLISDIIRSCKRLIDLRCPLPLDSAAWTHLSNLSK